MRSGFLLILGALTALPVNAEQAVSAAPTLSAEQQAMESQAQGGRIARSAFTTGVVEREPVDSITELTTAIDHVYYYTELLGMAGQSITHRWSYNDTVIAEVTFDVGGPRWRVWSSKNLVPGWTGDWKVSVVNSAGEVLGGNRFAYTAAQ